ncbi:MAG: isochorismate synthase [Endomicrobiales bacterium]
MRDSGTCLFTPRRGGSAPFTSVRKQMKTRTDFGISRRERKAGSRAGARSGERGASPAARKRRTTMPRAGRRSLSPMKDSGAGSHNLVTLPSRSFKSVNEFKNYYLRELAGVIRNRDGIDTAAVVRVEIGLDGLLPENYDLIEWFSYQDHDEKIYFSGSGEKGFQAAGLGEAFSIARSRKADLATVFKKIRTVLSRNSGKNVRFYGGLSFSGAHLDASWSSFGTVRFVIPKYELFRSNNRIYFASNFICDDEEKDNFRSYLNGCRRIRFSFPAPRRRMPAFRERRNYPGPEQWKKTVSAIMGRLKKGTLKKVVLARKSIYDFDGAVDPMEVFRRLDNTSSGRYDFCCQFKKGAAFLGSSPELLYRKHDKSITCDVVAGSRERGATKAADKRNERELLASKKEIKEHEYVLEYIRKNMKRLCADVTVNFTKKILKLQEGQHIYSKLSGKLKEGVSDEAIIETLHPTPAICGYPRNNALNVINKIEPFKRGWYSGLIGAVGKDYAEFAVGLRSALIAGNRISLFSGAGIVEGSDYMNEWKELEYKIGTFVKIINNEDL